MPGIRRVAVLLVLVASLAGCDRQPRPTPIPPAEAASVEPRFVAEAFGGDGRAVRLGAKGGYAAYDVVAADMDLDGDQDVLVNWHLAGLELFENSGGRLSLAESTTGLSDAPGIPSVFADDEAMHDRLSALDDPAIAVWHSRVYGSRWNLWMPPVPAGGALRLELECTHPIVSICEPETGDCIQPDQERVELTVEPRARSRHFVVRHRYADAYLRISDGSAGGDPGLQYLVGSELVPRPAGTLELWRPDPHGMAWAQALGSSEPELVVARGGVLGVLAPPHPLKRARFFAWDASAGGYRQIAPETLPGDYARSRSVAWVDIDNDGVNELYFGNFKGPNVLWQRDAAPGTSWTDRARKLGLDRFCGDSFAWMDVDRDGWQDLVFACRDRLAVARNVRGQRFETEWGDELGLALLERSDGESSEVFSPVTLSVLDLDADGRLDLWVSGLGEGRRHRVFRGLQEGFEDVTEALGLSELAGSEGLVPLDADDDGFADLLLLGSPPVLLRSRDGEHYDAIALASLVEGGPEALPEIAGAATAADIDGDGRTDLVLVGTDASGEIPVRTVAFNRSTGGNRSLTIELRQGEQEPVGTLVRVRRSDGRSPVQRHGSAWSSHASQTLRPLHFGLPAGSSPMAIEVLWPGATEWRSYEPTEATMALRRE